MENQNQNNTNQNQPLSPAPAGKTRFWKFAAWFVGIVVIVLAAASLVSYLSPGARRERELQRNLKQYQKGVSEMEDALRADTYGGKTPQETLDMFVDALKKGDVELASKYFVLETNVKSPDYLTRDKARIALENYIKQNGSENLINILTKLQPSKSNQSWEDGDYELVSYGQDGRLEVSVFLILNSKSQVWKISGL